MKRHWNIDTKGAGVMVDDSGKEWVLLDVIPACVPVSVLRKVLDDYYAFSEENRKLGICKTLEHLIEEEQGS